MPARPRSGFVTATAWTFIACALLGILVAGGQLLVLSTVIRVEDLRAVLVEVGRERPVPSFVLAAFDHLHALLGGLLALSIAALVASVGLLRRRDWGRIGTVALCVVAALWNFAGGVAPLFWFSDFARFAPADLPPEFRAGFEMMIRWTMWASVATGLAFAAAFAWLAKRLRDADIREEFARQGA
jgi:hypothetical protein